MNGAAGRERTLGGEIDDERTDGWMEGKRRRKRRLIGDEDERRKKNVESQNCDDIDGDRRWGERMM
jgi:hypothetical protein